MRKHGEYIIDKRLKFKKGFQRKFIDKIKRNSQKTWLELANILDLHTTTLRVDWYTEKTTIPKKKAKKLLSISPFENWDNIIKNWVLEELPPKWGQIKGGGKNKKTIKTPPICEDLAEFIGAALGDGSLSKNEFNLSSDATQKDYVYYIKNLIYNLFNLDSKIFLNSINKNNLLMDTYSIELVSFLQKKGLTIGNKIKKRASFPEWIFEDDKLSASALRGLFDTDGGIYEKQKGYRRAIIEFQTKSPYIHKDILKLLNKLGFKSSKGNQGLNIRIQNQEEVHKFFKIVGSSNLKNIIRYKEFLKSGCVPKRKETIELMEGFNEKIPFKVI